MVVADQGNWLADVVFVIEGTANLSPYVESLKNKYIIPTLEYFNGGPAVDRDCGYDENSTMYALVVFMAADCAPETAATCFAPTANTHKFLTWLDKVMFIGGAGESHSHIAEGLSTALQVFDDFQTSRDNNSLVAQKHCILICNSPPYPLPALESSVYSGLNPEQLATLMAERQINFSIFSPRKIPALFKLFEKAGGDLQHALSKKYAKDLRHLVFLRGFQLQERPMSPAPENKAAVCSPPMQGQKRPATNSPPNPRENTGFKQPATQSNYAGMDWAPSESPVGGLSSQSPAQASSTQGQGVQPPVSYSQSGMPGQPNQQMNPRPNIPTPPSHLSSMNQPNPPNVTITSKAQPPQIASQHPDGIRPQRGHSPVTVGGPRMSWNQAAAPSSPASTSPTTSVLATQLSMAPTNMSLRHPNAQMAQLSQPVTLPNLASQSQSNMNLSQGMLNQPGGPLRPSLPGVGLRMTTASAGSIPSIGVPNSLSVQLAQHPTFPQGSSQQPQPHSVSMGSLPSQGMPSNMQAKLGNTATLSQMIAPPGQPMASSSSSNLPQMLQGNMGSLPMAQSGLQSTSQPAGQVPQPKDRRSIWQGAIEFQEKPPATTPQQAQRVTHSLSCTFSSVITSGEPDVNADKWPNRLVLQLIPKQLIVSQLFTVLKTAARHVLIHFNQESDALQKLCKTMSTGWVGCIQFPGNCDIKIMIVLYMPDKRIYMGFIANDQESFFNTIRQMYESHRKQQAQKQRLQQLSGNPNSENMGLPSSTSSNQGMMMSQPSTAGIGGNNNPMGPRMPIGQQQVPQSVPQISAQVPAQNTSGVHSTTMNQPQQQPPPQPLAQQQATNARLSQLEAARQQNLLKIQQLQQTLEAAQQKELQYKAAQEQQQQQQHQQQQHHQQQAMIERQNTIRQLQQQIQQQQQQLQQQQQRIQMQQVSQSSHNPQLRNLLQQQVQQQIRQQQAQQQILMQQQHSQSIRSQLSSGGISSTVGQPSQSQQQSQQQQSWNDTAGILDLLPP